MDANLRKEQFSRAYVRAVVAAAGYSLSTPEVDEDSVDFTIHTRGGEGSIRSPKVDIQLKCTDDVREKDPMPFRLKRKNYVDLQGDDFTVARILVVVFVPTDVELWLDHSEERLSLSHCGYWLSLRAAMQLDDQAESVTVHLPRGQLFSVEQLRRIVENLGSGVYP
jgi:hypothetical protein